MLWGERRGDGTIVAATDRWSAPMRQPNDLSRSLVALDQDSTLIAVIEMGQASWLVAGIVPGVNRHPLKKIATDQEQLLQVLRRWAKEAETTGRVIKRIAVAYEAGRDGFWLARWLRARGVEAYVIHRRASRSHASTGGRRPIAWTPSCSSAPFSAGCRESQIIAVWRRSRR